MERYQSPLGPLRVFGHLVLQELRLSEFDVSERGTGVGRDGALQQRNRVIKRRIAPGQRNTGRVVRISRGVHGRRDGQGRKAKRGCHHTGQSDRHISKFFRRVVSPELPQLNQRASIGQRGCDQNAAAGFLPQRAVQNIVRAQHRAGLGRLVHLVLNRIVQRNQREPPFSGFQVPQLLAGLQQQTFCQGGGICTCGER